MRSNSVLTIERIRTDQLKPNRYNPNRMTDGQFLALKRAIRKEGFCGAILANRIGNRFVIVDGEHRWRAARDLGLKEVPCLVGEFTDSQAQALTIKMNQIHGYWSAPELVSLLDEIPDSLKELGFSDHEFKSELERALGDTSVGKTIDIQLGGTISGNHHGNRRYVGFMLSRSQQRLLERSLKRASLLSANSSLSRCSALAEILKAYLTYGKLCP